jgi:predicted AAA+ superfamily ATPase
MFERPWPSSDNGGKTKPVVKKGRRPCSLPLSCGSGNPTRQDATNAIGETWKRFGYVDNVGSRMLPWIGSMAMGSCLP